MRAYIVKYGRHPFVIILAIIAVTVVLTLITAPPEYPPHRFNDKKDETNVIIVPPPKLVPTPLASKEQEKTSQRISVAGQPGYFIVVQEDGASYLEGPDGKKIRQLADASPREEIRVPQKLITNVLPKRSSLGQLIVCDKGVVDVPVEAVITFIGVDRVVTHNPDGTSVIYHTDGKIEIRGLTERELKTP